MLSYSLNSGLKILDLSQNVVQIGILHALRHFIEHNKQLNALSISGLHMFNERAWLSICQSLGINGSLQTIDFGNMTQWQFEQLMKVSESKQDFFVQAPDRILKDLHKKKVEPDCLDDL